MHDVEKEGACLGLHGNVPIDIIVRCLYNIAAMKLLRSFNKLPLTLFRAKSKAYASLRENECPIIPPGQTCYPRTDERWLTAPTPPGFGISILPNGEKIRALRGIRHVYVFNEGFHIPESLVLY